MRVDVTIHGAGVFGLSIAFACALRGARVRVRDPGGVAAGASGGVVGALAPHAPEGWTAVKQFQFDSLIAAAGFWARVESVSGLSTGYARTGRLQPVPDAAALERARARVEGAQRFWQGLAAWEVVAADGCAGLRPVSPTGWLIRDTLSARLHPRRACAALAAAVAALGGTVSAEPPEAGSGGAPEVWATGHAGLAELRGPDGRPAGAGVKGQAALLSLAAPPDAPQLYADGLHIVPHDDGTVAVGSTTERDFADPAATDAALDAVLERARAACPELADAPVLARWAGLRPRARSRQPVLGPHPARAGAYIANGGFKIGFGIAPGVAEAMADLVLDGRDRIPEAFRPLPAAAP